MSRRRILRAAAAIAVAALAVPASAVLALPASANSYYKYWSYWHKPPGATAWQYSSVGASGYYLVEGSQVEGWRFAVGTASPSDPQPRPTNVSYAAYCPDKFADKPYRVLLVADYGTEQGAPPGPVYSCYGFDDSVNGFTVLTQQHSERDSGGLICAIDGYPHSGCGETVSSPAPSKSPAKPPPASSTATGSTAPRPRGGGTSPTPTPTPTPIASVTAVASRTPNGATVASGSAATVGSSTPDGASSASARPFTGAPAAATGRGFPTGVVLGLAAVLVFAGAAAWQVRRSR